MINRGGLGGIKRYRKYISIWIYGTVGLGRFTEKISELNVAARLVLDKLKFYQFSIMDNN